jgi:hypothetical protein
MTTLPLDFATDIRGFNAYAPAFANVIFNTILESDTEQSMTIPTDAQWYIAAFSYQPGTNVYVALDDTAVSPSSSVFVETTSEYLPAQRFVPGGSTLSFVTPDLNSYVTVSFYASK